MHLSIYLKQPAKDKLDELMALTGLTRSGVLYRLVMAARVEHCKPPPLVIEPGESDRKGQGNGDKS